MRKRVLLVEPDRVLRAQLRATLARVARVDADAAAPAARVHLLATPYDWLITNLRLEAYNGLHLAHLAAATGRSTRMLLYGERVDLALAWQCQRLPAFYEPRNSVRRALDAYLNGPLPPADRRDPARGDRRTVFRGGRRRSDAAAAV